MNNNSGNSKSLWMEVEIPSFPALEKDLEIDVCIVGSGIAGLSTAYTLAKQGKSIVVLDQGVIAGGQTARTTAHLTYCLDKRYYNFAKSFGEESAKIIAESHSTAIDYIEKIAAEEKIECDFERVDGYLFLAPGDSHSILDQEYATLKKLGLDVDLLEESPSNFFETGPCLRFANQAQFHVLKYLSGLTRAILKYKGKIFNDTHVNHFQDGSPCIVKTESGFTIRASSVIVATCTPVNNRFIIHTKQAAYRTYVIAASIPKASVSKGLYWDTADPFHYIRTQTHLSGPDKDWLIVGGEDHRTGEDSTPLSNYAILEEWTKNRFPMVDDIQYHWSGQIYEPVDRLAFIGKNPEDENVYICTGDAGNGITHGTIAGILIPDLILKKHNPWENLYKPSRKTFTTASEYFQENFNTILQYSDWFTPGELDKIDQLPIEEGVIMREGMQKIAVFKDKEGQIHINSAFCPHLGGCVHWNQAEKSWDCPCHGSRFDAYGKVITGPAISSLTH